MGNLDDDSGRGPGRPARMWRLLDHVAASRARADDEPQVRTGDQLRRNTRTKRIDANGGKDDKRPSGNGGDTRASGLRAQEGVIAVSELPESHQAPTHPRRIKMVRRIVAGSSALFFATALTLTIAPAASAKGPRCSGAKATIAGTDRSDKILGTRKADVIVGLGGDDVIIGGRGNDTICGGRGNDKIRSGGGSDATKGDAGNDDVDTGPGYDWLYGEPGNDLLDGGPSHALLDLRAAPNAVSVDLTAGTAVGWGSDTLTAIGVVWGSAYDDVLSGSAAGGPGPYEIFVGFAGNDTMSGLGGDDLFQGGEGNDTIEAGDGNDEFELGPGDDVVDGGPGFDWLSYFWSAQEAVTVDLSVGMATGEGADSLSGVEAVFGSVFDDTLIGDDVRNQLYGDCAAGGCYADGEPVQSGDDVIDGGGGDDFLAGGGGEDQVYGEDGNDELDGWKGNDDLDGGPGDDDLLGWQGDDHLDGGTGTDYLTGGDGNDACLNGEYVYECEEVGSRLVPTPFAARSWGTPRIRGSVAAIGTLWSSEGARAWRSRTTRVSGMAVPQARAGGTDLPRCDGRKATIVGAPRAERLVGTHRADVIAALGGSGIIVAGRNGVVCAGPGDDTLVGARGEQILLGGPGADSIDARLGSDRLEGGRGDDTLVGGRDGDFLVGGTGHDLLDGGRGSDDEAAVGGSIGVEVDLTNGTATGEGHDTLAGIEDVAGSQADDTITGDAKANEIEGGAGDDVLSGGDGDDYFLDNSGDNHADGGEGTDIIDFWPGPGVTVDLASGIASTAQSSFTLASIEWVGGSSFDDTLIGDAGPNLLFGWYGNDELIGSDGDDTLLGAQDDDLLDGWGGFDTLDGGDGSDVCSFGETISNCEG
jgi:Ca2+-binding RTX toxin-like protein